jgi:dihydrofolate reductase
VKLNERENQVRKLILKMSISVDGFVSGPNGEIDWIFRTLDWKVTEWIVDTLWNSGVHIMGSKTYQDMAAYWPTSTEAFAAPMNEIPKIVFTKKGSVKSPNVELTTAALKDAVRIRERDKIETLNTQNINGTGWANPSIASGNLTEEIFHLKQLKGKDILAHGGASFAQSLVEQNLIDEYRLVIHPVVLGKGLPLFAGLSKPIDLELVSKTEFNSGVVAHVYQPKKN